MSTAPTIYAPRFAPARLGIAARLGAAAFAVGFAAVLTLAATLEPSGQGVGTHTSMGFKRCLWIEQWNMPCPSCGMTTSFAHMMRGNVLASLWVQPAGAVLAVLTAAGFWVALYIAVTGKPALRLLRVIDLRYYLFPLMFFAIAAWGWKIFAHTRGIGGW